MSRFGPSMLVTLATAVTVLAAAYLTGRGLLATNYAQMESARPPDVGVPVGEIVPGREVIQSFTARRAGLSRIDVKMGTYGRVNAGTLTFHLRERPDGPDIRTLTVDAGGLPDGAYFPFTFNPIDDSGGRRYYLVLTSSGTREGRAVTVWASKCDCLPDGALLAGPPDALLDPPSDLMMITYFSTVGAGERLAVLAERVETFKPAWLGWPVLVLLVVLSGLSFAAMWYAGLSILVEGLTLGEACAVCGLNIAAVGVLVWAW